MALSNVLLGRLSHIFFFLAGQDPNEALTLQWPLAEEVGSSFQQEEYLECWASL